MSFAIKTLLSILLGVFIAVPQVAASPRCRTKPGHSVSYDKKRKRCVYKKSSTGKWIIKTSRDSFTGERFVFAYLPANGAIQGFTRSHKPTLFIRCREDTLDIYVVFGAIMSCSSEIYDIRLDNTEPMSVYASPAEDCSTMFLEYDEVDNFDLLYYMRWSNQFRIRADVYAVGQQTATFNLRGIGPVYDRILAACPDSIDDS